MAQRGIFDSITGMLEDFLKSHIREINVLNSEIENEILKPLQDVKEKKLSQKKSVELLSMCLQSAEAKFGEIASTLSLDIWMSLLRRFPQQAYSPRDWKNYLHLGILRYSAIDRDSSFGTFAAGNQFGLILGTTEENLYDAFRLAKLSSLLADIAGTIRWIGKGAKLYPTDSDLLNLIVSDEVITSVSEYERRRPQTLILQDEGFLVPFDGNLKSGYLLFTLHETKKIYWLFVPNQNLRLKCNYLPYLIDYEPIMRLLRNYEDAIEDLFNVSVDAISQVFCGLTMNILNTLPKIKVARDSDIEITPNDGSDEFKHKLEFMFSLCHKGSLRFSLNHWIKKLAQVKSPWWTTPEQAEFLVESFFDAFLINTKGREKLDLSLLRPIPFAYESTDGNVYIDLLATFDFLAWILERAKEWYSSQHGDRFTLSLKRWIESNTKATVICSKESFLAKDGSQCEVDLLVLFDKSLYSIECKAMAKSRTFFRGDLDAVRQRRHRVKKASHQAINAASAVQNALILKDERIPPVEKVEWLVCTPTQEYLRPPEEFGFIYKSVPRICTPEELVFVFNSLNQS